MATDSRAKMVMTAAALIARRGVNATSFNDVLAESGAPRGSIYHHFPEGKLALATEAVELTAERVLAFQRALQGGDPRAVLERFIGMWRRVVVESNAETGCAIAGVTVDSPQGDPLIAVARVAFGRWIELLTAQLVERGIVEAEAKGIAVSTVAGLEGALILCRAEGGVGPLDVVGGQLLRLLPQSP